VLTAGPAAGSAFPGDNGRIVFQSTRDGGPPEIYSMNPDGTDQRRLTNTPAGNFEPSFSPDGRTIVFGATGTATPRSTP
jgi:Tol biopolymer transport system component